jgi:hypothetical protein
MPRPRKTFTDEQVAQVEKLAAVLNQEQIADFLGISERTLRDRIRTDPRISAAYKKGRAAAMANVAATLVKQAQSGNVTAAIFYLKTQAGWSERLSIDLRAVNLADLTDEQLERIAAGDDPAKVLQRGPHVRPALPPSTS